VKVVFQVLFFSGFIVFSALLAETSLATPVADPKARVDGGVGLYWLDDDRLLFKGFGLDDLAKFKESPESHRKTTRRVLYVLSVKEASVSEYATVDVASPLCASAGKIIYSKSGKLWFGDLGKEQEVPGGWPGLSKEGTYYPQSTSTGCFYRNFPGKREGTTVVKSLLERDGFLEFRPDTGPDRSKGGYAAYLWRPGVSPVRTGVSSKKDDSLDLSDINYAAQRNAYLALSRDGSSNRAWWIFPDGRVEVVRIAKAIWNEKPREVDWVLPARNAIVAFSMLRYARGAPQPGNVYVLRLTSTNPETYGDQKIVFSGNLWAGAVSPNGCKVAVAHGATRYPSSDPSRLEILNICN
jgi:hypothetical protein